MKRTILKNRLTAILLCAAMLSATALTGCAAANAANDAPEAETQETAVSEPLPATGDTLTKDETVYVLCGSDGSPTKVIVSDWLKNGTGEAAVTDSTDLDDVTVTKGDTTYTLDGSMTVWDAEGGDVYYQGTSSSELPVSVAVSYTLDGSPVKAEELKGQSGHVTVRFDYTNNARQTVEIDGEPEQIYVPFVMLTGMMLDDSFKNVTISNGKLINTGDTNIAVGFALPGMQENLGAAAGELEIPASVEISADVTDFAFGSTLTLATNELFGALADGDTADLETMMTELGDGVTRLLDGSSQLYDGLATLLEKSETLVSAIDQMASASATLNASGASLAGGAGSLRDNLVSLQNGLSTLCSNNDSLNTGAATVFNTLLAAANTQLASAGLDKLGLAAPTLTIDNYSSELSKLIAALGADGAYNTAYNAAYAAVKAKVLENEAAVTAAVTTAVQQQVLAAVTDTVRSTVAAKVTEAAKAQVETGVKAQSAAVYQAAAYAAVMQQLTAGGMDSATAETYLKTAEGQAALAAAVAGMTNEQKSAAIAAAVSQQMSGADVQASIAANTEQQMKGAEAQSAISANYAQQLASDEVKAVIAEKTAEQIDQLTLQNMGSAEVTAQITAAVASCGEGAEKIVSLKTQLDQYGAFYSGLRSYTAGVAEAYSGAQQLTAGADTLAGYMQQLSDGLAQLDEAMNTLKTQTAALPDGVKQLRDGAMQLSDGLHQFCDRGLGALTELSGGDMSALTARVQAMLTASADYNNYSGIADGMDGSVKFIFKTAEIGA